MYEIRFQIFTETVCVNQVNEVHDLHAARLLWDALSAAGFHMLSTRP